jgi:hypothetical protein
MVFLSVSGLGKNLSVRKEVMRENAVRLEVGQVGRRRCCRSESWTDGHNFLPRPVRS